MDNRITQAIHTRLRGDATLVALLGRYRGEPSIFSAPPVPSATESDAEKEAAFPMIVIAASREEEFGDKLTTGFDLDVDLACVALQDGSVKKVQEVAARARELFKTELTGIPGFSTVMTQLLGGGPGEGEETDLRTVSFRLIVEES